MTMIADTSPPSAAPSPSTSRLRGNAGQHRWQSSGARQSHLRPRAEMDVLISGPHTGLMNEAPQPAEWPTWWS